MDIKITKLEQKKDERGRLVQNEDNELANSMKHFHVSSSVPGAIRGQHYHNTKTEWFLVLEGKARIICKDLKTEEILELKLEGDDPQLVKISPKIAHTIENIGDSKMYLLAFVDKPFDEKNPDTIKYELI